MLDLNCNMDIGDLSKGVNKKKKVNTKYKGVNKKKNSTKYIFCTIFSSYTTYKSLKILQRIFSNNTLLVPIILDKIVSY